MVYIYIYIDGIQKSKKLFFKKFQRMSQSPSLYIYIYIYIYIPNKNAFVAWMTQEKH